MPIKEIITKTFICPYCGQALPITSNDDIITHVSISKDCSNGIDFLGHSDEDILKRLIRNGLLNRNECFVTVLDKPNTELRI